MIGELGRRSATALLVHSALIQAVTFLVRPAATYRALELDVPGFALGLLAASYAVFPLLLAVPTGGLVDRIAHAFLNMQDPDLLRLMRAERFARVSASDYDTIRNEARRLGLLQ